MTHSKTIARGSSFWIKMIIIVTRLRSAAVYRLDSNQLNLQLTCTVFIILILLGATIATLGAVNPAEFLGRQHFCEPLELRDVTHKVI